jgi:hypothetical protein
MARNIRVTDVQLYRAMKTTMMRSLRQSTLMKMYALERDVPVRFHGHGLNEPVNYCMVCEEEVRPQINMHKKHNGIVPKLARAFLKNFFLRSLVNLYFLS